MYKQTSWIEARQKREMRPGVTLLTQLDGEHMTVGVSRLDPGNEPKPHSHESEQIACILQGTVDFHVGDEVIRLGSGDILHIPAHVEHYGVVVGDEPVLNLDAWYPHRKPGT